MPATRPAAVLAIVAALLVGIAIGLALTGAVWNRIKNIGGQQAWLQPPDAAAAAYRRQKLAFFRASPAHGELIMLGDSHIEGGPWAELLPGMSVLNRGIGWDTSRDVQDRLDEVIAKRPRAVFVQVGLVDLRYGAAPRDVAQNIAAIASRLREAGIRPVVQSVLPVAASLREPTNARVREVNDTLRSMLAAQEYLDLNPVLAKDGALDAALTHDSIHLSPTAYPRWAAAIRAVAADRIR